MPSALLLIPTNLTVGQSTDIETSSMISGVLGLTAQGVLVGAKYNSINVTTGSLAQFLATGAALCAILSTNATPGVQRVRTAAQMLADTTYGQVGMTWVVRIINSGAGTLTLIADAGATVTIVGTATVPQNTFRDFLFNLLSATTASATSIGAGVI